MSAIESRRSRRWLRGSALGSTCLAVLLYASFFEGEWVAKTLSIDESQSTERTSASHAVESTSDGSDAVTDDDEAELPVPRFLSCPQRLTAAVNVIEGKRLAVFVYDKSDQQARLRGSSLAAGVSMLSGWSGLVLDEAPPDALPNGFHADICVFVKAIHWKPWCREHAQMLYWDMLQNDQILYNILGNRGSSLPDDVDVLLAPNVALADMAHKMTPPLTTGTAQGVHRAMALYHQHSNPGVAAPASRTRLDIICRVLFFPAQTLKRTSDSPAPPRSRLQALSCSAPSVWSFAYLKMQPTGDLQMHSFPCPERSPGMAEACRQLDADVAAHAQSIVSPEESCLEDHVDVHLSEHFRLADVALVLDDHVGKSLDNQPSTSLLQMMSHGVVGVFHSTSANKELLEEAKYVLPSEQSLLVTSTTPPRLPQILTELSSGSIRGALRDKGLKLAAKYSAVGVARQLINLYEFPPREAPAVVDEAIDGDEEEPVVVNETTGELSEAEMLQLGSIRQLPCVPSLDRDPFDIEPGVKVVLFAYEKLRGTSRLRGDMLAAAISTVPGWRGVVVEKHVPTNVPAGFQFEVCVIIKSLKALFVNWCRNMSKIVAWDILDSRKGLMDVFRKTAFDHKVDLMLSTNTVLTRQANDINPPHRSGPRRGAVRVATLYHQHSNPGYISPPIRTKLDILCRVVVFASHPMHSPPELLIQDIHDFVCQVPAVWSFAVLRQVDVITGKHNVTITDHICPNRTEEMASQCQALDAEVARYPRQVVPAEGCFQEQYKYHQDTFYDIMDVALVLAESDGAFVNHRPATRFLHMASHGVPTIFYATFSYMEVAKEANYKLRGNRLPAVRLRTLGRLRRVVAEMSSGAVRRSLRERGLRIAAKYSALYVGKQILDILQNPVLAAPETYIDDAKLVKDVHAPMVTTAEQVDWADALPGDHLSNDEWTQLFSVRNLTCPSWLTTDTVLPSLHRAAVFILNERTPTFRMRGEMLAAEMSAIPGWKGYLVDKDELPDPSSLKFRIDMCVLILRIPRGRTKTRVTWCADVARVVYWDVVEDYKGLADIKNNRTFHDDIDIVLSSSEQLTQLVRRNLNPPRTQGAFAGVYRAVTVYHHHSNPGFVAPIQRTHLDIICRVALFASNPMHTPSTVLQRHLRSLSCSSPWVVSFAFFQQTIVGNVSSGAVKSSSSWKEFPCPDRSDEMAQMCAALDGEIRSSRAARLQKIPEDTGCFREQTAFHSEEEFDLMDVVLVISEDEKPTPRHRASTRLLHTMSHGLPTVFGNAFSYTELAAEGGYYLPSKRLPLTSPLETLPDILSELRTGAAREALRDRGLRIAAKHSAGGVAQQLANMYEYPAKVESPS